MCGIVGILGTSPVAMNLVDALRRLEYRGYDSAGIATLSHGCIARARAEGKIRNLEQKLLQSPIDGSCGIAHTRWATHGKPTEENAHPHVTARVAVVHNGIIENFRELRTQLEAQGAIFTSQTDTETVLHLVDRALQNGMNPVDAVKTTLPQLRGAFALVFIFADHDNLMIGARKGSPLAIGFGENEMFLGSDAIALAPLTHNICYLEEGDWCVLTRTSCTIFDEHNAPVQRPTITVPAHSMLVEKGNYRHYMLKEIHVQPEVIGHTFRHYVNFAGGTIDLAPDVVDALKSASRIVISACGTAYYAGLVARYWFEHYAKLPVDIDIASEFRYREPPLDPNSVALVISQSGETADTLAALRMFKAAGLKTGAVVNVHTSSMAREAHFTVPTFAGPEIGVASTKAFTCQLAALASLVVGVARLRGTITPAQEQEIVAAFAELPRLINAALKLEPEIEKLSHLLDKATDVLYLGRGVSFPIAMEGALKLKEISYIHAEGYAAGELKHGPIALIDDTLPVIVVAPFDELFEKTLSNMQEVAARGGKIILLTNENGAHHAGDIFSTLVLPNAHPILAPFICTVPIQLLAYYTAVQRGTDVDQPRNLAKSVTVE